MNRNNNPIISISFYRPTSRVGKESIMTTINNFVYKLTKSTWAFFKKIMMTIKKTHMLLTTIVFHTIGFAIGTAVFIKMMKKRNPTAIQRYWKIAPFTFGFTLMIAYMKASTMQDIQNLNVMMNEQLMQHYGYTTKKEEA